MAAFVVGQGSAAQRSRLAQAANLLMMGNAAAPPAAPFLQAHVCRAMLNATVVPHWHGRAWWQ